MVSERTIESRLDFLEAQVAAIIEAQNTLSKLYMGYLEGAAKVTGAINIKRELGEHV